MIPLLLLPALALGADPERTAESRVTAVDLFKNGLAVVHHEIVVPGAGTYWLDKVPEPVHGTLWVDGEAEVDVRATTRTVEVPAGVAGGGDVQHHLAGRQVTVALRSGGSLAGRVVAASITNETTWDRNYETQPGYYRIGGSAPPPPRNRFLVLETAEGQVWIDSSEISHFVVADPPATISQTRPALVLEVGGAARRSTVRLSYLTKGLAWAPSYRVDLSDPRRLNLTQEAVVRNELRDLDDVEMRLITGYPSIELAHVVSPLARSTSWASFFQQLSQQVRPRASAAAFNMAQQTSYTAVPEDLHVGIAPSGEGPDVHYQSIGRRRLAEGDALAVTVASGAADYERVVEWIVPDTRDAYGRRVPEHQREQQPDKYRDTAWDAVRFQNPLPFPMTTAPAMIVDGDRFQGQRMSYWVARGAATTLHVTKALSLRTSSREEEVPDSRERIVIDGDDYRRTTMRGELAVSNHRAESVKLVIRRRFSGELVEADGEPRLVLREEGAWSVNRRNELTWVVTLEPGAETRLEYRYTVLVDI